MSSDGVVRKLVKIGWIIFMLPGIWGCGRPKTETAIDLVTRQVQAMSMSQRAAYTVAALLTVEADTVPERLRVELSTGAAGALLVPASHAASAATAVEALRKAAPRPLLVLVELSAEGGAFGIPPAHYLASLAPPATVTRAGQTAARAALSLGGDLVVVGLSALNREEPMLPPLADPERVAGGFAAYVEGARAAGVGIALRALDVADGAAEVLRWDRARLETFELRELETMVPMQVAAVELGPVRLPALTGDSLPLPLSPAATQGLLRRDLQFKGVLMTDLSRSSPLVRELGLTEAAIAALAGGTDLLLGVEEPARVVDAIVAAVGAGRLDSLRVADAAKRVLRLRRSLTVEDSLRQRRGDGGVGADDWRAEAAELGGEATVQAARAVAAACTRAQADSLLPAGSGDATADTVVGGPPRAAMSREAVAISEMIRPAGTSPAAIVCPPAPALREAPADSLGMDPALPGRIDEIMRNALEDSIYSGAAVAVGRRGGLVLLRGYGREGRQGQGAPVDPSGTIFDLASLTKVVGTTTAVALLVQEGSMDLDAPLRRYLPEFTGEGKGEVLIRHLLTHTSGLPPGLWLFGSASSPEEAWRQALAQRLLREPGERVEYSDLGMMLLAVAAERAAGNPLDRLLARRLFGPLGMQSTMYLPPLAFRSHMVPTAELTERDFPLLGIVHDANAFRMGGIAGHAGLFSTARDLAVFAQMMLNGGSYGTLSILSPETVAEFTRRQPEAEQRALGWDSPSRVSSAGAYFSNRSFGHTGYTGTSLWADPESGVFVVLLTNRTYAEATAREVLQLRTAVHDAAARAVTNRPVRRRN